MKDNMVRAFNTRALFMKDTTLVSVAISYIGILQPKLAFASGNTAVYHSGKQLIIFGGSLGSPL